MKINFLIILFSFIISVDFAKCQNISASSKIKVESGDIFHKATVADLKEFSNKYKDSISSFQAFHGFRNSLMSAQQNQVVMCFGDSRIDQKTISESLRIKMIKQYGNGGIGFYINGDFRPTGITAANPTIQAYSYLDNTGDALYSHFGKCNTITAAQTTSFGAMFMETSNDTLGEVRYLDIYTLQKTSGGTLEIKVLDKTTSTVYLTQSISTTGTNNTPFKTTLDLGQPIKNLRIEYRCLANQVTVLPTLLRRGTPGLLLMSCGNGAQTSSDFVTYNTNVGTYFANQIKPNLLIILLGVNDATSSTAEPSTVKNNINTLINTYRLATNLNDNTSNNYFSAMVLGETGSRISEEYEDRFNSCFYSLQVKDGTKNYISFCNLKDMSKDWEVLNKIQSWAWTLNDNVHFGIRGGQAAADYIWHKLRFNDNTSSTLFPRIYTATSLGAVSSYNVSTNTPTYGNKLYSQEIADYAVINKVLVTANGIKRVYSATATPLSWNYSGDVITVYNASSVVEPMFTLEVQIIP